MKFRSIKFITTALIFVLGAVSISTFSIISYINTKENLEKRYEQESELVLKHTNFTFKSHFESTESALNIFAYTLAIQETMTSPDYNNLTSVLEILQKAVPNSSVLRVALADGRFFAGPSMEMPKSYDPRQQNWYLLARAAGGKVVWTEPYLDYLTQRIIITAAKAIKTSSGGTAGVIAVDFDVATISDFIGNAGIGSSGFVMLLSKNGTVIANKENRMIGENIFGDNFQGLAGKSGETIDFKIKRVPYKLRFSTLDKTEMVLVAAINVSEIDKNLYAAQLPMLSAGVLCLLIFCIIAYIYALKGIAPLERLVFLMKRAEDGDYHVYADLKDYEEVSSISKSFNSMIRSIRRHEEELTASNRELAATQDELLQQCHEMECAHMILKENEEKIKRLAYYDSLTGLSNREKIIEALTVAIQNTDAEQQGGAVIFIDLDNFKTINDTMGHTIGDKVLVEIAGRFDNSSGYDKNVARIGGDEFIILVKGITSPEAVTDISGSLIKTLNEPVIIDSICFNLTASIGVALFPLHGTTAEEILKKADLAMYRAKANGKNCYEIFNENMQVEIIARVNMENELRRAVEKKELTLHYQPQYNIADKSLYGVEALLRWHSPKLGRVPPPEIIKTAEETGLIIDLEKWILKKACLFANEINTNSDRLLKVSVNISPVHLMQNGFLNNVQDTLATVGVNPNFMGLEITETVMMESFGANKKKLEKIKDIGMNVLLDDFGSGYSSLSYLQNLPIDYVKIDKVFIDNILNSERDGKIAATIVELAHNIGLKVIAEGVETKEQFDLLKIYNCDIIQGYYLSRPISEDDMLKLLRQCA